MSKNNTPTSHPDPAPNHELSPGEKFMIGLAILAGLYLSYRGVKWLFTQGTTSVTSAAITQLPAPSTASGISAKDLLNVLNH